jgi:hypothetical protein
VNITVGRVSGYAPSPNNNTLTGGSLSDVAISVRIYVEKSMSCGDIRPMDV